MLYDFHVDLWLFAVRLHYSPCLGLIPLEICHLSVVSVSVVKFEVTPSLPRERVCCVAIFVFKVLCQLTHFTVSFGMRQLKCLLIICHLSIDKGCRSSFII